MGDDAQELIDEQVEEIVATFDEDNIGKIGFDSVEEAKDAVNELWDGGDAQMEAIAVVDTIFRATMQDYKEKLEVLEDEYAAWFDEMTHKYEKEIRDLADGDVCSDEAFDELDRILDLYKQKVDHGYTSLEDPIFDLTEKA